MYRRWIVTFGGAGLLPAMPGTFGSLAAAIIFYLLWLEFGPATQWIVSALLLIVGAVGIGLGRGPRTISRPPTRASSCWTKSWASG